jgi:starch phosphorylase
MGFQHFATVYGHDHGDDPAWNAARGDQLHALLEQQVFPQFYDRDEASVPSAWIFRMRESMARLAPAFSAKRCVRKYTEKHYVHLARAYRRRSDAYGTAESLLHCQSQLSDH